MKRGKKRKLDPAVEDEWRSEHGDTTDYGGQDGRRSVEMRARDTTNQPMEKRGDEREHETQLGEMRARHTVGDESTTHNWRRRRSAMEEKRGAEDTRLWRRREGLRGGENR